MLHKYTLKFSAQEWEDQYLEYLYPQMQKELSCFSLFAIGFSLSNFLLASIKGYLIYSLISLFAMLTVIYGKYLLTKKPNYLNYILGIYQVLVSISFLANDYLPIEQKISNDFVWSYGFQCSFFHFSIYLQGTNFISQNIILLCIFALYISVSQLDSLQGILNMFMWVFMFISMVMIKHNYEIRKKEEFFHSQQQIKWDKIVQSVLPTYVMLIGFNQKQDQLVLKKINRQVQKHFQISDDKDMRKYLRQLIIQKSVKLTVGQQINEDNFETYIRNMIQIDKYSDPIMQNNTTQLYVKHSENQQIYKAKLVQCILENELQCLLVLQRVQTNQQTLTKINKQISVDIIGLCVNQSRQVMQILSYLKETIKLPQDYYRDHIFTYNSLLNFQYVLLSFEVNSRYQLLNQLRIQSLLKNIFGNKLDNLRINSEFFYKKMTFTRVLITCIRLITAFNNEITPQFDIDIHIDPLIDVTITFKNTLISKTMLYLLQENWAYSMQRQFRVDSIYLLVLSKITEFHQLFQKRLSLLTLFEICSLSITLAQFGVQNYLDIQNQNTDLIVKYTLNTKDNVKEKIQDSFSHHSIHLNSPKSDTA